MIWAQMNGEDESYVLTNNIQSVWGIIPVKKAALMSCQ